MAFHLPALLAKAKAFLATPKGRKTALIGAGGAGAVVLGLRAKKKGTTTQQEAPADALDSPTPSDSGGFTFPSDPIIPPDTGAGGGQTTSPALPPSQSFDPGFGGGGFGGGGGGGFFSSPSSPNFQTAAELPASDPTLPLPGGVAVGPALFGASFGMSLPSNTGGALAKAASIGAIAGGAGKAQGVLSQLAPPRPPVWATPLPVNKPAPPPPAPVAFGYGGVRPAPPPPPPPRPAPISPWIAPPKPVAFGYGGVKPAPPKPITKPLVRLF